MIKNDTPFKDWFGELRVHLLDLCGLDFNDEDVVRLDYEKGREALVVAEEIADDYERADDV
jgi:hypothetical protein